MIFTISIKSFILEFSSTHYNAHYLITYLNNKRFRLKLVDATLAITSTYKDTVYKCLFREL